MKQLEMMKENLMSCVMGQMADLKNADTKELGEAIDMIKDLSEAIYYCTVTEAMKGSENKEKEIHYYTERIKEPYITSDKHSSSKVKNDNYQEREYPMPEMRDPREGRSYISRRMYMESKEMGRDKLSNMHDLETYMTELGQDITEMIEKASPEEKQMLQKKLNMLAQKVVSG